MTIALFPAMNDFFDDEEVSGKAQVVRVYMRLVKTLDFSEPREVKTWLLAEQLRMKRPTVGRAIRLLLQHQYLRGRPGSERTKRPPRLRLTWSRRSAA